MTTGKTSLDGHVAMVTGGASGISRAIALALGRAGACPWIADIDDPKISQAVGVSETKTLFSLSAKAGRHTR